MLQQSNNIVTEIQQVRPIVLRTEAANHIIISYLVFILNESRILKFFQAPSPPPPAFYCKIISSIRKDSPDQSWSAAPHCDEIEPEDSQYSAGIHRETQEESVFRAQVNLYEKEFYALVRSYSRRRLSVVLHQTMHLPKAHW
ncbi:hypothetical protein ABVT39_015439 [Epinephelus coioides]